MKNEIKLSDNELRIVYYALDNFHDKTEAEWVNAQNNKNFRVLGCCANGNFDTRSTDKYIADKKTDLRITKCALKKIERKLKEKWGEEK